jgi:hypothetical protein
LRGAGDLDADLVGPVSHREIDEIHVQHVPQPVGEALGDLARVVADPHGGERREGDEIPDTATKLLDFASGGLCLCHRRDPVNSLWANASRRSALLSRRVTLAEFAQELVWWYEERVLLEDPADDHHRVGPEDVQHDPAAEFVEIKRAHDKVVVLGQEIIDPSFILQEILNPRTVSECPFLVGPQPSPREAMVFRAGQDPLEQRHHRLLVEASAPEMGLLPDPHLDLIGAAGRAG